MEQAIKGNPGAGHGRSPWIRPLKVILEQALKAQREVEVLLYTIFNLGARRSGY
jgi:hypothetical protein